MKTAKFEEQNVELRDQIETFGRKESLDFIASGIEFMADLIATGQISLVEIRAFRQDVQLALKILRNFRDDFSEAEIRRLREAVEAFNRAVQADFSPGNEGDRWSLSEAMDWRERLDYACQICEACCEFWRTTQLDRLLPEHREPALRCIEEIEKRIRPLRSGRLADVPKQREVMDQCVILSGQLAGYADEIATVYLYAEAIVHDPKKWAAFLEALITSKWRDASAPCRYLTKAATTIYNRDVRPDVNGPDSQGFNHRAGPGGHVKDSDALRGRDYLALEEIAERPDDVLVERRFTERSVSELQKAAEEDPRLSEYVHAIVRNPGWKREAIWKSLGWTEKVGKAVDRKFRRLRRRLKEIGAGMDWRTVPTPGISEGSQTTYFEALLNGTRGRQFGVLQHKPLKTQDK